MVAVIKYYKCVQCESPCFCAYRNDYSHYDQGPQYCTYRGDRSCTWVEVPIVEFLNWTINGVETQRL
jgi:hypothetical protein